MDFAKSLRLALEESGMTQKELAEQAGIPRSTVSQYLSGAIRQPGPETLGRISEALGGGLPEPDAPRRPGLSVREAAALMGKSVGFVQEGLKAGVFPFGWGVRMPGGRWSYWISPAKFSECTGLKIDQKEKDDGRQ